MADSPSVYDLSGLVFSAIGVIVLLQTGYDLIHNNLPAQRVKELNNILSETDAIFRLAVQDGLIFEEAFRLQVENHLLDLNADADKIRAEVYIATDTWKQICMLATGLSRTIGGLIREVERLRASVSAAAEEQRQKLERSGLFRASLAHPADLTYPVMFHPDAPSAGSFVTKSNDCFSVPSAVLLASNASTAPMMPEGVFVPSDELLSSPPTAYLASAGPSSQPVDVRLRRRPIISEAQYNLQRLNTVLHPFAHVPDSGQDPRQVTELLELLHTFNENVRSFHIVAEQHREDNRSRDKDGDRGAQNAPGAGEDAGHGEVVSGNSTGTDLGPGFLA